MKNCLRQMSDKSLVPMRAAFLSSPPISSPWQSMKLLVKHGSNNGGVGSQESELENKTTSGGRARIHQSKNRNLPGCLAKKESNIDDNCSSSMNTACTASPGHRTAPVEESVAGIMTTGAAVEDQTCMQCNDGIAEVGATKPGCKDSCPDRGYPCPMVLKGQWKSYLINGVAGTGSFGAVFEATCVETEAKVAVKRVLLDPRYKNRELQIMAWLKHPNIVELRDYFVSDNNDTGLKSTSSCTPGPQVLHLMMEYVPTSLHTVLRAHTRANKFLPMATVRLFMFQLLQAAGYLHGLGLAHRDIKLPNILVDMKRGLLKICDFGCAKVLVPGSFSVPYICTRFYRAPELIMGQSRYGCPIDLWSVGCVFGELLGGLPLFRGESSTDQLVKIVEILGTPCAEDCEADRCCNAMVEAIGTHYKPLPWEEVIPCLADRVPAAALDLLERLLQYVPERRIGAYEACSHPFFDELYDSSTNFCENLGLSPPNVVRSRLVRGRGRLQSPSA